MIYLLKDNIKFLKIREEKIIPIMSLTTTEKIHISTINVGDLIFDICGSIASVTEITSENQCKVIVLSTNSNNDNNSISSFR